MEKYQFCNLEFRDRFPIWPQFKSFMIHIYLESKTESELIIKIENYYNEYPSAGYGTSFKEIKYNELLDLYQVYGTRGRSCD